MRTVFKNILLRIMKLKGFFVIKNPELPTQNEYQPDTELVAALEAVSRNEGLDKLLKDPVSKIYVITTYSLTYNELGSMLIDRRYNRKLVAVNLHSYFNGDEPAIATSLVRIAGWLKTNKCTPEATHDLYEITRTVKHLLELKG